MKLVTDETRYFRADTQESARDWMGIIRKAALIKVGTAPARDAPGRSPSGRPLSTKGRSPSLEPVGECTCVCARSGSDVCCTAVVVVVVVY